MIGSSTIETPHLDKNAPQILKTIKMTTVIEISEPIDDTVFHIVYASG